MIHTYVVGIIALSILVSACGGGGGTSSGSGGTADPAFDLNGYWTGTSKSVRSDRALDFWGTINQAGTRLQIKTNYYLGNCVAFIGIGTGTINGDRITITFSAGENTVVLNGTVTSASQMSGTYAFSEGCLDDTGTWSLSKYR